MKESGILMPVSALPSSTGVGELGADTFRFIKNLKHSGVKIWQILPLNPAGYGNSPYQPYSSCAGDEIYISLEELYKQGLLKVLPEAFRKNAAKVDYQAVREWKEPYLREACSNFQETEDYQRFVEQPWVKTYGMFRALKKENGNRCWNEWKDEDKSWPETGAEVPDHIKEEVYYQMFLQYVFYCQWMAVKKAANDAGIRIMGDVPFMWEWILWMCGQVRTTSFWIQTAVPSLLQEFRLTISAPQDRDGEIPFMTGIISKKMIISSGLTGSGTAADCLI